MSDRIYVATESFSTVIDGEQYAVRRDKTRVREGHKLLKSNSQYFKPVEDEVTFEVERATRVPGEKRSSKPATPEA